MHWCQHESTCLFCELTKKNPHCELMSIIKTQFKFIQYIKLFLLQRELSAGFLAGTTDLMKCTLELNSTQSVTCKETCAFIHTCKQVHF